MSSVRRIEFIGGPLDGDCYEPSDGKLPLELGLFLSPPNNSPEDFVLSKPSIPPYCTERRTGIYRLEVGTNTLPEVVGQAVQVYRWQGER